MTRRKVSSILWGIVWIALGVAIAMSVFGYLEFWPVIRTWWPLLIIVPCFVSFITNGFEGGSLVGLAIGVMLLLYTLDVLTGSMLRKLIIPVVLILIGLSMIFRNLFIRSRSEKFKMLNGSEPEYTAVFSTKTDIVQTENFMGAKAEAVFGTVTIDLRSTVIAQDAAIDANATFGQVNILTPENVNVKAYSTGIFGSCTNHVLNKGETFSTLYVDATSVFGGVSVR